MDNSNSIRKKTDNILQIIAEKRGITLEQVRAEIEATIRKGMESQDPEVKAMWEAIATEGYTPSVDELVLKVAQRLVSKKESR